VGTVKAKDDISFSIKEGMTRGMLESILKIFLYSTKI